MKKTTYIFLSCALLSTLAACGRTEYIVVERPAPPVQPPSTAATPAPAGSREKLDAIDAVHGVGQFLKLFDFHR